MAADNRTISFTRWWPFCVLAMVGLFLYSGCKTMLETTYSIEEQYNLSATRSVEMSNQVEFSFRLTPDHVPFGQDIFFVAIFTNTTDHPIVFREPRQQGVVEGEYPDTTLLFSVKSINGDTQ